MLKFNLLLFIPLILLSCSSGGVEKTEMTLVENRQVEYPSGIDDKLKLFPLEEEELKIDSGFFRDSTRNHRKQELDADFVKLLAVNLSKDDMTEPNAYYLKEFYTIEKAKKDKKYDDFLEKLDIGMTKDAHCYALKRMEFGDSIATLLWRLDFTSYEACPFFHGSHYMLSTIYQGKVVQTIQLAASESAADAPVSSTIVQEALISPKGKASYNYESTVEEEGLEIERSASKKEFVLGVAGFVKK